MGDTNINRYMCMNGVGITCLRMSTDVVHLREKWRIMGGLVGALPSQPRQNAQLGLPLKLMPEETALLLEMGEHNKHAYGNSTLTP